MTCTVWIAKLMTRYRPRASTRTSATSVRMPLPAFAFVCADWFVVGTACLVDCTACSPYRAEPGRAGRLTDASLSVPRGTTSGGSVQQDPQQAIQLLGAGIADGDLAPAAAPADADGVAEALLQLARDPDHDVV